ncbi:hypothetical protein ACRTDU_09355 [Sunxiuqinia elliptica]
MKFHNQDKNELTFLFQSTLQSVKGKANTSGSVTRTVLIYLILNKKEKYYLEDIFKKFIIPHFSINDFIIFFEWDRIAQNYRYVVTPQQNKNKFFSFHLHKRDKVNDFEVIIIYTNIDGFNFHNTQKLLFLLAHDDLKRFKKFYQDFIDDLNEESHEKFTVDFFIPFTIPNSLKK